MTVEHRDGPVGAAVEGTARLAVLPPILRRLVPWALLALLAMGMRLIFIQADPPDDLSSSRAIYNDGGAYALNARHKLLTGAWLSPGDNVCAQAPGFTLIAYQAFWLGGLGLAPLRLLSVIGTVLAAVLVARRCREWGRVPALIALAILGTDYLFVMYGRLELIEGLLASVVTAACGAACESRQPAAAGTSRKSALISRLGWAAIAAVLLWAGFLIKPTAAVIGLPIALFLVVPLSGGDQTWNDRRSLEQRWGPLVVFLGVSFTLAVLYRVFFYLPHEHLFLQYREAFRQNASGLWDARALVVWSQIVSAPGLWDLRGVPLLCLAVAGIAATRKTRDPWGVLLTFWLLAGLLYLAPQTYRPSRFTVLYLPAAAGLAARGAIWLWEKPGHGLNLAACTGWLVYLAAATQVHTRYPIQKNMPTDVGMTLLALGLLALGLAARARSAPGTAEQVTNNPLNRGSQVKEAGGWIAGILLFLVLAGSGVNYMRWVRAPRYSLLKAGDRLAVITGNLPIAGDNWCEALALMSHAPAYKIDWLPVAPALLERYQVRYLVFDSRETRMPQLYGSLIRRGRRAATLRVGHYHISVVQLAPGVH